MTVRPHFSTPFLHQWGQLGTPQSHRRRARSDTGRMAFSDTSEGASEVLYRRLAEMTPSERVAIGAALWTASDSLQRAAARRLYPAADDAEITFRVAVTRFGEAVARAAYGRE